MPLGIRRGSCSMGWSAPTRDIQPWHSQYLLLWGPVLVHNFVFRPRHTLQSNISGTLEAMTKMLCSETLQLGWSGRAHKFAHIHICICIRHPFPYYLSIYPIPFTENCFQSRAKKVMECHYPRLECFHSPLYWSKPRYGHVLWCWSLWL